MKKFVFVFLCGLTQGAYGLGGITCWFSPAQCPSAAEGPGCTSSICSSCGGGMPTIPTGYTGGVGTVGVQTRCDSSSVYSCYWGADTSSSLYTLACASGYYGTASYTYNGGHTFSGCTKCPSNATCAGGNGSAFVCAKGYYKSGTACSRCPSSGGVYGTTASTGATAITQCYLPSGTEFSDDTGSGTYTGNCYYSL